MKEGRIHAKANGMLIAVNLLEESKTHWKIKAWDEKRSKTISKKDTKNQVFESAEDALIWQDSLNKGDIK